jgi:hypothetical protein
MLSRNIHSTITGRPSTRGVVSYANVVATLALVFAMSGGALAANHYLIESTKQLSPKVLKALKGKAGAKGAAGTQGKEGPRGPEGPRGKDGPAGAYPATLPAGQSESGTYAVAGGSAGYMAQGFAFPLPLASALDGTHVAWLSTGTKSAACPGFGKAAPGFLCVYETAGAGASPDNGHAVNSHVGQAGADPGGFMLFFAVKEYGFSYGSWTLTAP